MNNTSYTSDLADNHAPDLSDNFRSDLGDNFSQGLGEMMGVGPMVGTVVFFAVASIPTVAGFLFLKDRWTGKGKKRSSAKRKK